VTFRNTTVLWGLLAAVIVFIPFAYFTPRVDAFEVMNAMIGTFTLAVAGANLPETYQVLRLPARDLRASHILTVALEVVSASLAGTFIILWFWRAFPDADWIIYAWGTLLTRFGVLVAYVMMMAVRFNSDGVIQIAGWRKVAMMVSGAAILAVILIMTGVKYG
jgi:ribulose-5-phosphate 4-epimerase/fuculose-1-phosphate aldolase